MLVEDLSSKKNSLIHLLIVVLLISFVINLFTNSLFKIIEKPYLWLISSIIILIIAVIYFYFLFGKPKVFKDAFVYSSVINKLPQTPQVIFDKRHFDFTVGYYFQQLGISKSKWSQQNNDFKQDAFLDILELAILSNYAQKHTFFWLPDRKIEGIHTIQQSYIKKEDRKITFNEIKYLQNNSVYETKPSLSNNFTLPDNTKLGFSSNGHQRGIIFKNKYLTFKIYITSSRWSVGNRLFKINNMSIQQLQDNFETISFNISTEIIPNSINFLFKKNSMDYYIWAEEFWKSLKNELNDLKLSL